MEATEELADHSEPSSSAPDRFRDSERRGPVKVDNGN